jgi:hypothetical protein
MSKRFVSKLVRARSPTDLYRKKTALFGHSSGMQSSFVVCYRGNQLEVESRFMSLLNSKLGCTHTSKLGILEILLAAAVFFGRNRILSNNIPYHRFLYN